MLAWPCGLAVAAADISGFSLWCVQATPKRANSDAIQKAYANELMTEGVLKWATAGHTRITDPQEGHKTDYACPEEKTDWEPKRRCFKSSHSLRH